MKHYLDYGKEYPFKYFTFSSVAVVQALRALWFYHPELSLYSKVQALDYLSVLMNSFLRWVNLGGYCWSCP